MQATRTTSKTFSFNCYMSGGCFKCISGQLDDVFTDWGKKLQILVKLRQKKV